MGELRGSFFSADYGWHYADYHPGGDDYNLQYLLYHHGGSCAGVGKDKSNRCNDRSAEKNRFAGRISCCRNSSSARTSDRFSVSPICIWMYFQAVPE